MTALFGRRPAWTLVLIAGVAGVASAQSAGQSQGGLEFILPIGARTLGMGQAATAAATGSDALWWNPALVARGPREAALQITQTLATQTGSDAGFALIYAEPQVGAVALSVRYLNTGAQPSVDSTQQQTGTIYPHSTIVALTFAAPFGDRLAVGLTTKLLRIGFSCTGVCTDLPASSTSPQTGALDFGAQYVATKDSLISFGVAIRNLGFKLQINDAPQADALPSRAHVGIAVAPRLQQVSPDVRIRGAADVVWPLSGGGSPGVSLGGELSYKARYQLRGGYVENGPTGSGLTFGVGVSTGRLQIDFARMLDEISSQAGVTPTFVAFRYLY